MTWPILNTELADKCMVWRNILLVVYSFCAFI